MIQIRPNRVGSIPLTRKCFLRPTVFNVRFICRFRRFKKFFQCENCLRHPRNTKSSTGAKRVQQAIHRATYTTAQGEIRMRIIKF